MPGQDGDEEVVAFVEVAEGQAFDVPAVQAYLKERLSPYKRPQRILRVATIPRTASGSCSLQLRGMLAEPR